MELITAANTDAEAVMALYKSVIGRPFCTWNDDYPGEFEINHDLETGNLFLLKENGEILGAVSVVPENELDDFSCWHIRENAREIARVVIDPRQQGKGFSSALVRCVLEKLKARGCKAVHLSVAEVNIPAQKTYFSLGFRKLHECDLYGHHFFLCEKAL